MAVNSITLPNPLHQFEIRKIFHLEFGGLDVSFTNASLFMVLTVLCIVGFMSISLRSPKMIPDRAQIVCEVAYEFIENMIHENVGDKGKCFFPFIFSIFFFILFGNLLGMIPYAYTFTSQIIVTFSLAILVFFVVTLVGFIKHGVRFFTLLVPKGLPVFLYPLVILIETLSYLSRPVTLSVRLFANMMAGHTILKVFAGFSVVMGVYFGIAPSFFTVLLLGFEFMVAILQAYVFTILTCIYLHDALYLH